MPPTQNRVQQIVENSIGRLFEEDEKLLLDDANERSITHRLAMHLEEEVAKFEIKYSVDVEYNRVTEPNGATDDIKKRVDYDELPEECQGRRITDSDTHAQTVFPDIIIHKRGSSEYNFLVIEVKKTSSSDSGNCDKEKLKRFHADLGYETCLFLRLKVGDEPDIDDCYWYPE